ncbi:3-hydroxyacyl-CoA dehydrogenase NAD-binding domain-containing protein [Salipiger thiooxidans]|uniref:3-hydroxyacyl-CoA dehydrogenase NAD-binding domain-containing protein n=1 Tax=Salipiger thiooxidans TaxID=282683 RepID=UPI001CD340CD|nr:3-hydroxyacyl-CoA dehydrogenase NAD-binding domain-containing protein [Salipiger thiooxidans]MCA0851330.1 3-hydroxyacyl-CoA dehydrogenase [Salipiger thiooxidans]
MKNIVAILGAGLIGRGWARLAVEACCDVRLFDRAPERVAEAQAWLATELPEELLRSVQACATLEEALAGATHAQECAVEDLALKRDLLGRVDAISEPGCTIASSTSALLPAAIFEGFAGGDRCLVAHPASPPHLLPVVEIVPGPQTSDAAVSQVTALMERMGQEVIRLKQAAPGLVLNRLQAALVEEALALVEDGIATPDGVDLAVRSGIGMRWAFAGPFEVMDLNAANGFADYVRTLGPALAASAPCGAASSRWHGHGPDRVAEARRELLPLCELPARQAWLADRLTSLRALKCASEFTN